MRHASEEDFDALAAMHLPVWRGSYRGLVRESFLSQHTTSYWATEVYPGMMSKGRTILIAEGDTGVVGVAIFGEDEANSAYVELEALYITKPLQRRGVGAALLDRVLVEESARPISLSVARENWPAKRFYTKWGFQPFHDGKHQPIWSPQEDVKVPVIWLLRQPQASSD